MKQRRAFTLVELLTTMTIGSSIMLLAIGLVHQSMSMSKLNKARWEHDQSLARLAQQFRSDVHAASEVISVSAESLLLKLDDGSLVTYKRDAGGVILEKASSASASARDVFRLSADCQAVFVLQTDPNRIVLQVERSVENTEFQPPVDLRVVAMVGRWKQLEQGGGTSL
jgi:prepilin-type N-terminal cleavage/methylation domain-containing protein